MIKAGDTYDIHSPFIYNLYQNVLTENRTQKKNSIYNVVENIRKELLKDNSIIKTTSLGAGSKSEQFTTVSKRIKAISQPAKSGRSLSRLTKYFKPGNIIELGTAGGIGTMYLSLGNPSSQIITIEGDSEIAEIAKNNFEKAQLNNIKVVVGTFKECLEKTLQEVKKCDLLFIDGDHSKEGTLCYLLTALPYLHENSIVVVHDIHWSEDMENAWQEICNDARFPVTIDIFHYGIIIFSSKLSKQNFVLKINNIYKKFISL